MTCTKHRQTTGEQAGRQASEQASKRVSEQASEQADKHTHYFLNEVTGDHVKSMNRQPRTCACAHTCAPAQPHSRTAPQPHTPTRRARSSLHSTPPLLCLGALFCCCLTAGWGHPPREPQICFLCEPFMNRRSQITFDPL